VEELISKFDKNATEEVRVSLSEYQGKQYINLRVYYQPPTGDPIPTKKGLTLSVNLYPELREAIIRLGDKLNGNE
jgi:hypothetical protein